MNANAFKENKGSPSSLSTTPLLTLPPRSLSQYHNAEDALAEMDDEEEMEREVEEVEDMLEYYMQRSAGVHSEAGRILAGESSSDVVSCMD